MRFIDKEATLNSSQRKSRAYLPADLSAERRMMQFITTDELRSWLAMWQDMKQSYDTQHYDLAVARFGADMVAHFNVDDIEYAIRGVEAQLAARGAS
jgi:hypothetical protein